jgi:hypothetical protein
VNGTASSEKPKPQLTPCPSGVRTPGRCPGYTLRAPRSPSGSRSTCCSPSHCRAVGRVSRDGCKADPETGQRRDLDDENERCRDQTQRQRNVVAPMIRLAHHWCCRKRGCVVSRSHPFPPVLRFPCQVNDALNRALRKPHREDWITLPIRPSPFQEPRSGHSVDT